MVGGFGPTGFIKIFLQCKPHALSFVLFEFLLPAEGIVDHSRRAPPGANCAEQEQDSSKFAVGQT
jgi:hypothetical protein